MDYQSEIPFAREIPKGFFDTQEEDEQGERLRESFDPKKQQLGNKRKGELDEGKEQSKRQKNDKSGPSVSAAAMKAAQMQKIREAEQSSKRRGLVLPAPQVQENELEDIIKMGLTGQRAIQGAGTDNDATRGLVGNYSMASATPIRTPRAAPENDRIANELQNIRALTEANSALLGGENTPLAEISKSTLNSTATPNPLATPFRGGIAATPVGATPLRTPRDNFNLNRDSSSNRENLLRKLAALPKAKELEFELEAPEEVEEVNVTELSEEDAAVRDARNKQLREAAELTEFNRQTQVIQKRLPRPSVIDIDAMLKHARAIPDPIRRDSAIETALLIANDAFKFGGARVSGSSRGIEILDESALQAARWEVALEQSPDKAQKQKGDFDSAFAKIHSATKLPGLDGYYEDEIDEHQMMVEVFDNTEDKISEAAGRSNELEKKLAKLHGGYQNRAKTLREKISEAAEAFEKTSITLHAGLNAQVAERAAIPHRLEKLRDEVALVSRREREAQEEYRRVKDELDDLTVTNGVH
jgi:pre-mRNA-splicing factor CDC5/CEF1